MTTATVPAPAACPDDLPDSLRFVVEGLSAEPAPDDPTPPALRLKRLIVDAGVTAEDLAPWADFDCPDADSYGRKLVYDGGHFEIMAMSWRPGDCSAVHDHGYTEWGAVQVFGPAEHAVFAVTPESVTNVSRTAQPPGRVMVVDHEMVHQMKNPTDEPFLSLHIYGCPDRDGDVTADARVFDLARGEVQITGGGVFYALPEDKIDQRKPCPQPGFYEWLHDSVQ
ncbi:MAG: cysteine dioxygenase family protein, partial [Planctomycetota bacterium]